MIGSARPSLILLLVASAHVGCAIRLEKDEQPHRDLGSLGQPHENKPASGGLPAPGAAVPLNSSSLAASPPAYTAPTPELSRKPMGRHTPMGPLGSGMGPDGYQAYRQPLTNFGDVQYTAEVDIGDQTMQGIIDTGSFEILVFGDECKTCGKAQLYSKSKSSSFVNGSGLTTTHSFGSGPTKSVEGFESIKIGPYHVKNQAFWEVTDARMQVLQSSAQFSAILGVGPPNSAKKLAAEEAHAAMQQEEAMQKAGMRMPKAFEAEVKKDEEAAEHANAKKSLSQNLGINTFSVCIGKQPKSPGYFIWNDANPENQPFVFTHIPVVGKIHWGVDLRYVRLGHQTWTATPHDSQLGCGGSGETGGCGAVVDSGTSLIAAPTEVIRQVEIAMQSLKADCSNLDALPDLVFNLGGSEFSLPPDSYIGEVEGYYANNPSKKVKACQPLLMPMDTPTHIGPMWILGLPFFRKYYITFVSIPDHGTPPSANNPVPMKRHLYAAEASLDCRPQSQISVLQLPSAQSSRSNLRRVDRADLHLPEWAHAAQEISPGTIYEL
eukprot:gnl/TRDRNA2_/TRDRNA2_180479_c0_seq1.p1 gnl/TRDRNA2_/TRDRNA2_180479_c0~~gnl/TRDRNA2_/TRDRNA2_180479_c0_seq1.p1  ORF type:complete len:549 (-),score=110.61 gnl/TRDRNA2_/TRDRNA2_180479_c0_seq1:70-1716(-)